jgi:hypothetical protein
MLHSIYEKANSVLKADANQVSYDAAHNTKDEQKDQNVYSNDSTYFQNLEASYNSMVDAGNTAVSNLSNGQTQLATLGSTLNGDSLYMSNLMASPLAG